MIGVNAGRDELNSEGTIAKAEGMNYLRGHSSESWMDEPDSDGKCCPKMQEVYFSATSL